MDLNDYVRCDATALREHIAAGDVTPAEVRAVARQAIEAANQVVNGLAAPLYPAVLDHAADGPFGGVPFLIKDSGPMAEGREFFLGSRSLRDGVPAWRDTDLMRRFRAAGLATLGLTTAPELSLSFATEPLRTGPTRNPWDTDRGVGGSSGGAAALVASGAVPVAHANDAAGSIRIPASACGLVGLKPSRGRTPCGPDTGEAAFGAAAEFALTRTVRDAAALLDAIAGPAVGDKYTAPPATPYADELGREPDRLRIAVATGSWSGSPVAGEVADVAVRAAGVLAELGHDVREASPSFDWDDLVSGAMAMAAAIAAPVLSAPRRPDPAQLEAVNREILAEVTGMTALDLMAMLQAQNRVTRAVGAFFTDHDLLITPTLAQLPPPHGTLSSDRPGHTLESWLRMLFDHGPFTPVFNVSGQPALSLPLGHSDSGLPIGVQFVAPYGREDVLFRVAGLLEQAMPWRDRTPTVLIGRTTG